MKLIQTELGSSFYLLPSYTHIEKQDKIPQYNVSFEIVLTVIVQSKATFYYKNRDQIEPICSINRIDYYALFGNVLNFVPVIIIP